MTNDTKTTISGLVAAVGAAAGFGGHFVGFPDAVQGVCGMIACAAIAFLGYYSNKPGDPAVIAASKPLAP